MNTTAITAPAASPAMATTLSPCIGGGAIGSTLIDMVTPEQACAALQVDSETLVDMINRGQVPAYALGGVIRLKVSDVRAAVDLLAAA